MPSMTRISKFLRVVNDEAVANECAIAGNNNDVLCVLQYYPPWRQWVMIPEPDTVWSHDCLDAVRKELVRRNQPPPGGEVQGE